MASLNSGRLAEEAAAAYLINQGYRIIGRNWKTPRCEIDIIARKDGCLHFIEVKYRATTHQGEGHDYVTPVKLRQMAFAAEMWVARHRWEGEYVLSAASVSGPDFEVEFIAVL